jgi:hypothetical protein
MSDVLGSERTLAGALFVLIIVVIPALALVGGFGLPTNVWNMPLDQKLRTIADHPGGWRAINAWFLVALVLSSLGFASVATQLRGSGLSNLADLALVLYVIGAVLWIVELTSRMSAMVLAAEETANSGAVPVWAGPLASWGFGLFIVYAALSNVAVLGFGAALLRTDLVAAWAGCAAVAMSILVLALLVITRDNLPALNLIAPIVIGIALLLPRS